MARPPVRDNFFFFNVTTVKWENTGHPLVYSLWSKLLSSPSLFSLKVISVLHYWDMTFRWQRCQHTNMNELSQFFLMRTTISLVKGLFTGKKTSEKYDGVLVSRHKRDLTLIFYWKPLQSKFYGIPCITRKRSILYRKGWSECKTKMWNAKRPVRPTL